MGQADSEDSLVDRASRGDPAALSELLERNLPRLRAYVRLRMGPRLSAKESASDLVQSACREVLSHLDRFQRGGESSFRHWLFATAFRKIQNKAEYYRAGRRDVGREVSAPTDKELAAIRESLTPSQDLMRREQLAALETALQVLSEEHREVLLLSRIAGLPMAEVARTLGKTEEATRSLQRRALAGLARAMDAASEP